VLLRSDQLLTRFIGTLFGLACCLLGLFLLLGAPEPLSEVTHSRAVGFAATLIIVGSIALAGSWTARDVVGLWYRKPRRLRTLQGKPAPWKYGDF
jgi:hypothetical protein